jgi:hypothetical protein
MDAALSPKGLYYIAKDLNLQYHNSEILKFHTIIP